MISLVVSKTRRFFPSDEKSTRFPASLSFPFGERNHARFGLQTVFSTTQPDHSITQVGAYIITVLEMHVAIDKSWHFRGVVIQVKRLYSKKLPYE
jgi:hypothetical protein